jgi:hypothetical protein
MPLPGQYESSFGQMLMKLLSAPEALLLHRLVLRFEVESQLFRCFLSACPIHFDLIRSSFVSVSENWTFFKLCRLQTRPEHGNTILPGPQTAR